MSLPAYLGVGLFSIYGMGNQVGVNGIVAPPEYRFSTVYNIWNGGDVNVQIGDSVMYKESDVCRLAYANGQWGLVEVEKIKLVEVIAIPT
jgi:hypothetical protein